MKWTAEESSVKFNNKELVAKVREWNRNLAMSGGKDWTLQVPVNFEKDPDVLIEELCKRLESVSASPTPQAGKIVPLKSFLGKPLKLKTGNVYYEKELLDACVKFQSQFNQYAQAGQEGKTAEEVLKDTCIKHGMGSVFDEWNTMLRDRFSVILAAMEEHKSQSPAQEGWIKVVPDKMPAFNKDVLGYSKLGRIKITFSDRSGRLDTYELNTEKGDKYTHWQPLPAPPKP